MEQRYRALRIVAMFYKALGVLSAVLTLFAALGVCALSVLGGAAVSSFSRRWNHRVRGLFV